MIVSIVPVFNLHLKNKKRREFPGKPDKKMKQMNNLYLNAKWMDGKQERSKNSHSWDDDTVYIMERVNMEFHSIMAEPFIKKANLIQNTFSQFDDKKPSKKSSKIATSLSDKISFIRNKCPEKIKNATQYQSGNTNLLLFIFLHEDISNIEKRFERIKEVYIPRIKTATEHEFLNNREKN
jgi:hypothetical protein